MLLRVKTQRELKWGASGCWIALYIYYGTRGLCEAIHRAMYCAYLYYDFIVELGLGCITSRVAMCIAQCTGLDYCGIRCTDKIRCNLITD